jgi:hypothetical protein
VIGDIRSIVAIASPEDRGATATAPRPLLNPPNFLLDPIEWGMRS